jgi:hypothetical protein
MTPKGVTNNDIAKILDRIADLLSAKGENPFRVRSYRNAASTIAATTVSIPKLLASKGIGGLTDLKSVGEKLAGLIQEYVKTGTVEALETLEKEVTVEQKKGIVRESGTHVFERPIELPAALILDVDEEYRAKAAAGKLKKIAPRLMNPDKKAWLPILATEKKGYRFTVMFSNTERAHELGKTNDWVVLYAAKGKGGKPMHRGYRTTGSPQG